MTKKKATNSAEAIFEAELRRRKIAFRVEEGAYVVEHGGGTLTIRLDNVARNFKRDGDASAIARFLENALAETGLPSWSEARSRVRWSAERSDLELGDAVQEPISETLARVLVYVDHSEKRITFLDRKALRRWKVTIGEAKELASKNLDTLLRGKRAEIAEATGAKLGMLPVDSAFKASLIFAKSFKRFVAKDIGWPVLVVIPCRDFVYVIADSDRALLDRMGGVVQREFRNSGYPLTTEVLRISDDGIEAIGAFPE